MKLLAVLLVVILCGCAAKPAVRYSSACRLENSHRVLDASSCERAILSESDASITAASNWQSEERPKFLRAPPPSMSPADIAAGVGGEVVVEIWFNLQGEVERTVVLSSTKESLTDAVRAAVAGWKIVPPRRNGIPGVLVARQAFVFAVER
jgi:TonB family protein